MEIKYHIAGKDKGNFKPRINEPDLTYFIDCVENQIDEKGIGKIYLPVASHSTVAKTPDNCTLNPLSVSCVRTEPGVDGFLITEPYVAVGFLNADCPIIGLADRSKYELAFLHAGFRSLVPVQRDQSNIIQSAFSNYKLDPSATEAFIGYGAGPCCYGVQNYVQELQDRGLSKHLRKACKGPRSGHDSLDLSSIARDQLLELGVSPDSIFVNRICTACIGRNEVGGRYYSNIYREKGRNLSFAWFI